MPARSRAEAASNAGARSTAAHSATERRLDTVRPVNVLGLSSGAKAISAGPDDACAVTGSGGAKCWGLNFRGQLGDGTSTDRATPVNVAGLTSGVTSIASGPNIRTCAIVGGARVMCWGRGRLTPVAVSGLHGDAKAITSACALTGGRRGPVLG